MRACLTFALLATCLLAAPAQADQLDAAIAAYATGADWTAAEVQPQEDTLQASLEPGADASTLGPLEKALLLFDLAEPPLPRSRTLLRYGQIILDESESPLPVVFIEVARYNLGPAIRAAVMADYGAENTAPPEDFGIGPHVAWRYVFMPVMGNAAALLAAARRSEIPEADADVADCLGRGCLDLLVSVEELLPWDEAVAPDVDFEPPYESFAGEFDSATPARTAAELALSQNLALLVDGAYQWQGPEQPEAALDGAPFLFLELDKDLDQDTASDAVLALTQLNDDSLVALWSRRLELPDDVYWFGAPVPRD